MMADYLLIVFLTLCIVWENQLTVTAQKMISPYSLQAAVDALHRREVQLALRDNAGGAQQNDDNDVDDEYWERNDDFNSLTNQRKLDKILANYLQREDEMEQDGYDVDDDDYQDDRKRSLFRKRNYKDDYQRKVLLNNQDHQLAEQFLREIEDERNSEAEERYREALYRLIEKYKQYDNSPRENYYPQTNDLMQRKRSYPILPWLPYSSKKKRFPVSKRSSPAMPMMAQSKKDEVTKDLEGLFGSDADEKKAQEKKKRSTNEMSMGSTTKETATTTDLPTTEKNIPENNNSKHEGDLHHQQQHHNTDHHHHNHNHHNHHHHGTTASTKDTSGEMNSSEEEHDDHGDEEEGDEHDSSDSEEYDDDKKKKRSVKDIPLSKMGLSSVSNKNKEILSEDLLSTRAKKSIDWSKYFGLDRRKKAFWQSNARDLATIRKRPSLIDREDKPKKKRTIDAFKLALIDEKLKKIEDSIIDDTIKYTGAHEGITDPEEIRDLKDRVVSRVATAYSIEKMRRNLDKLREDVDLANHLQLNEIEGFDNSNERKATKRISVKKENVEYDIDKHNHKFTEEANHNQNDSVDHDDDNNSDDDKKKKKQKRNGGGGLRNWSVPNDFSDFDEEIGIEQFEPHNDVYLGRQTNGPLSNQCPIIDVITDKCRGVEILSGDIQQNLLPLCGVHQLCYLCGTSQVACDIQFLSDANDACNRNNECQSAARSVLMILRGTSVGPQLGPNECLKNPCLYRAMREISL